MCLLFVWKHAARERYMRSGFITITMSYHINEKLLKKTLFKASRVIQYCATGSECAHCGAVKSRVKHIDK